MASAAEIADALDRLSAAAHRQRAAAAATRRDVNATDLLALDIVRRHPQISPGALAREMHLTAGGINGVIRRLIKARMLVRTTATEDRRDVSLEITRPAERLMTTGVGGWDSQLLEHLARLSETAPADVMNLLAQIAGTAEQRAGGFAEAAERVDDAAVGVPTPVRWG